MSSKFFPGGLFLLGLLVLSACGLIEIRNTAATQTAQVTKIAADVFATLTAEAPTPTDTPVPTETPSIVGVIDESGIYCTNRGGGGKEIIAIEPQRTISGIRIDLEERATGYGFSLQEVKLLDPDDTNLAISGEADALSVQDDDNCMKEDCFFAAGKAIDGNTSTRWSSDWYDEQWIEITLPNNTQVASHIVLMWEQAYARKYCISVIE